MINTQEYQYLKAGLEQEVTFICRQLDLQQYLQDDYLDQGCSLTMPFEDVINLIGFHNMVHEIAEAVDASKNGMGSIEPSRITVSYEHRIHTLESFLENKLKEYLRDEFEKGTEFSADDLEQIGNYITERQEFWLDEEEEGEITYDSLLTAVKKKEEEEREY